MTVVRDLEVKGARLVAFAALVGTFSTPEAQKKFIAEMHKLNIISDVAACLLIEVFALERV
jgi:hypothetical protein